MKDQWYQKSWRPICAFVYLAIVIFDFGIMPIVYEAKQLTPAEMTTLAQQFKGSEIAAFQSMQAQRTWEPLTLQGGAFFHLAFGALLTGAAVTRGMEKKARITADSA